MHDPRIGRFFAVDPLTSKYPHYTPYSFSGNKVIGAVELEGLEESWLNPQAGFNNVAYLFAEAAKDVGYWFDRQLVTLEAWFTVEEDNGVTKTTTSAYVEAGTQFGPNLTPTNNSPGADSPFYLNAGVKEDTEPSTGDASLPEEISVTADIGPVDVTVTSTTPGSNDPKTSVQVSSGAGGAEIFVKRTEDKSSVTYQEGVQVEKKVKTGDTTVSFGDRLSAKQVTEKK